MNFSTFLSRVARRLCLVVAIPALLLQAGLGQTGSTGAIEGRVQNTVTGRYLNNARIAVKGTNLATQSDEHGMFRLVNVPAGSASIEVFYTGLEPRELAVTVAAGQTVTQDVGLAQLGAGKAADPLVKLDPYLVASTRETDSSAIAINEQRFAPNIKNVVSTETHGEVMGGNLGQFLKFIPGVMEDVGGFEPEGILVRGFPTHLTGFSSDGAPLANGGSGRSFTLEQISINNISRVEVTKVPTPSSPADSLAGSVNMITKSAFERAGAQLRYNFYMTGNGTALKTSRQPDPTEEKIYRIVPGATIDYTLPITKNFGIVLGASHFQTFVPQVFANKTLNASAAGTGATLAAPFLATFQLQDSPQYRIRNSGSARADWRITRHSVLSIGGQTSYYKQSSMNYNFNASPGTTATPTVAGGTPFSYGPTFTTGATGRGSVTQTAGFNMRYQSLTSGDIRYKFDDGQWRIDAFLAQSSGKSWTRTDDEGFFQGFSTALKVPVRVSFVDIDDLGPRRTQAFNNANQPVDIYDINNYNLSSASTTSRDLVETMKAGRVAVKRSLDFLSVPSSVQIGAAQNERGRDVHRLARTFTYNGINGDLSASAFAAKVYSGQVLPEISSVERESGGKTPPYSSPVVAWTAYQANPNLFSMTPAQVVAAERDRVINNQLAQEKVTAWFFQGEMRLLNNRLNVLTGVRYEKTDTTGEGPLVDPANVFVRNANGTFARDASGQRIRKAGTGAVGSLEEVKFTHLERAYKVDRSYDGYYPSLHLTYNISDNFLARLAYAKTYGRPDFADIIPNTTLSNEDDAVDTGAPSPVTGNITVRNTSLRPWTGHNYDLSLEYYTNSGGLFSASVFHKDVTDFFGTTSVVATPQLLEEIGMPARYVGWNVSTKFNTGDAQIDGIELSVNHKLDRLGLWGWGRHFNAFANATKINLKGNQGADFSGFLPKTMNFGLTYSRKPIIVMAKWSWRDRQRQALFAALGPDAYGYLESITHLDLNVDYQIRPNLSLYLNARNFFNVPVKVLHYGSQTPDYAKSRQTKNYGSVYNLGIKGSF